MLRAWNSPLEVIDQSNLLNHIDDDESLDGDIFREDDEEKVLSLISLRLTNNKIEQSAAKELAKFLKNTGACLAEVTLSSSFHSSRCFLLTLSWIYHGMNYELEECRIC